jgi:hypothetical protein
MEEERDAISSKAWEGRLAAGWMTLGAGLEEVAGMVSMVEVEVEVVFEKYQQTYTLLVIEMRHALQDPG